jgi:hypothetical protein
VAGVGLVTCAFVEQTATIMILRAFANLVCDCETGGGTSGAALFQQLRILVRFHVWLMPGLSSAETCLLQNVRSIASVLHIFQSCSPSCFGNAVLLSLVEVWKQETPLKDLSGSYFMAAD